MEWQAEATVLSVRPHGESSAIVDVLTREQGRFVGLVRGGVGRRMRPVLQIGNRVEVVWRARLSAHLGTMTIEPLTMRAGMALNDKLHLTALMALCDLARILPERNAYPRLVEAFETLIDCLDDIEVWPAVFVRFELAMLEELGFGLDLKSCAATGANDNLTHVSPRSGRAVSASAAEPYLDKLYVLPRFFTDPKASITPQDIQNGFKITEYFLSRRLYMSLDQELPASHARMLRNLSEHYALSES